MKKKLNENNNKLVKEIENVYDKIRANNNKYEKKNKEIIDLQT
jgi:hypothetical protein